MADGKDRRDPAGLQRVYETLHSKHHAWEVHENTGRRFILVQFLAEKMPEIEPESWPKRFEWGGIFVNGRSAGPETILPAPCRVEYFEPKLGFEEMEALYPPFIPEQHIIHDDDDLLAAFKPAGLPSKPSKEQQKFSMLASLERWSKRRLHMPSRLDAATCGIIIAGKSRRANAALQRAFEGRKIHKQYLLEVSGKVDWEDKEVDAPIGRDPRHPVLRQIAPDGKTALTRFKKVRRTDSQDNAPERWLLSAEPLTGRTHQIRVHIASLGLPIIGDPFYGGLPDPELHLLSYSLALRHPGSGKMLRLRVPRALLPYWAGNS